MSTKLARTEAIDITRLAAVPTAALKAELTNALKLTAQSLSYFAAIWGELEKRGENLKPLAKGMGFYIARIAAGTLLAETVVMFLDDQQVLDRIGKLPVAEQRRIVDSGEIPPAALPAPKTGRPRMAPMPVSRVAGIGGTPAVQQNHVQTAAIASPRDTAELILKMIRVSPNPKELAVRLLPEIESIVRVNPSRSAI